MPTVELSDAELLALQYVLDNWVLTSQAQANAPFCYFNCHSISTKIGPAPDVLWDDPVCAAWYKDREENYGECEVCGEETPKADLQRFMDEELRCPECLKERYADCKDHPRQAELPG